MITRAYAKINLGLLVRDRRPDGYHSIETVFHRIDLCDELVLEPAEEISMVSDSRDVPTDEANLCFKAAVLLQQSLGLRAGVRITLRKNIPVGAGLGGGSADAAEVLRHLPHLWQCSASEQTVQSLALKLGSDVPYFLRRGSAIGRGRGDILDYFDLDVPYTILVCNPNIHISTAWAYQQVRPSAAHPALQLRDLVVSGMHDPGRLVSELRNDFEPAVFKAYPEVRRLKEAMVRGGAAFASLSGSGSSIYGFFSSPDEARGVSSDCAAKGYRTFFTPPHFRIPDWI